MSETDNIALEPLSSLSGVFDLDSENRLSPNYSPVYASLDLMAGDALSQVTPQRAFGSDLTNNQSGQFLSGASINNKKCNKYLIDHDLGPSTSQSYYTTRCPLLHHTPTLTSCFYNNSSTTQVTWQDLYGSSSPSYPESNFYFPDTIVVDSEDSFVSCTTVSSADTSTTEETEQEQEQPKIRPNDVMHINQQHNLATLKLSEKEADSGQIIEIENTISIKTIQKIKTMPSAARVNHRRVKIAKRNDANKNVNHVNEQAVKSEAEARIAGFESKSNRKIFPFRLWELASDENFEPLSWNSDGTMLVVNMSSINGHLPKICRTKKFASFLRQLHLYGFRKDSRCLPNKRNSVKMAYYQHQHFLRSDPEQLSRINRIKV